MRGAEAWHLAAGYEHLHIEKELPGSADLVLQKVVPRSFHAEAAWLRGSGNGLRWGRRPEGALRLPPRG